MDQLGSDIFPADENCIAYLFPHVTMKRVSWLLAAMNMLDRTVTLDSIPECHDHKILMVTLTVGVHDRVMFSAANLAGRMNQIAIPQVFI